VRTRVSYDHKQNPRPREAGGRDLLSLPYEAQDTAPGQLSGVGLHWGVVWARGYREPSSGKQLSLRLEGRIGRR